MDLTLLGSGDATGVPVPLCDCPYCVGSDRRRRPAAIVEAGATTVLLDLGPDLPEQLAAAGVRSVDAAFLTHAHADHDGGLLALHQAAKWDADHLVATDDLEPTPEEFDPGYPLYATATAQEHLADRLWMDPGTRLDLRTLRNDEAVAVGELRVEAVPVEHHRPRFDTVGFVVRDGDAAVAYAPDMRGFRGDPPGGVDLLVCEGAAILGQPVHGPRGELHEAIEAVGADRVVLVNVSEHLQRAHTDELRAAAAEFGYELGVDFGCYAVDG